jgi:hypothetical protein
MRWTLTSSRGPALFFAGRGISAAIGLLHFSGDSPSGDSFFSETPREFELHKAHSPASRFSANACDTTHAQPRKRRGRRVILAGFRQQNRACLPIVVARPRQINKLPCEGPESLQLLQNQHRCICFISLTISQSYRPQPARFSVVLAGIMAGMADGSSAREIVAPARFQALQRAFYDAFGIAVFELSGAELTSSPLSHFE